MSFFLSRRQNVIKVLRAKDSAKQGFVSFSRIQCRSRDSFAEDSRAKGEEQRAKGKARTAKSEEQRAKSKGRRAKTKGRRAKGQARRVRAVDAAVFALRPSHFALRPSPLALCPWRFAFVRLRSNNRSCDECNHKRKSSLRKPGYDVRESLVVAAKPD